MHRYLRASVFDKRRASLHAWRDRLRDPSLTALLVLQVFLLFVALPLAATGVPIAQPVAWLLLLLAVTLVVMLSQRGGAILFILLGLAAAAASFAFAWQWSPITEHNRSQRLGRGEYRTRNPSLSAGIPWRRDDDRYRARGWVKALDRARYDLDRRIPAG